MNLRRLTLLQKAILALSVILFPLIISFMLSYNENREHIKHHTLEDLTVVAEAYEGQVYQFIDMVRKRAQHFSTDGAIVAGLEKAVRGDSGAAEALAKHLRSRKMPLDESILRISVVSLDGRVISSTDAAATGSDVSSSAAFRKAAAGSTLVDQEPYEAVPEISALAPIFGSEGGQAGVIIVAQRLADLNKVLTGELNRELGALSWAKGKRKTMEAYLVNRDRLMITDSLFIKDAILRQRVDNEAVRRCLGSSEEFGGFYPDYRGVEVAGASMCLPSMGWTLLVEVDSEEILSSAQEIRKDAVVTALIMAGLILMVFYLTYRSVILRLAALSAATSSIASGEYDIRVRDQSGDEIGRLSDGFNRMSDEIRSRTALLRESEDKYRSLVANIPDVTWTSDSDANLTYVSDNTLEVLGYTPVEICSTDGFWESIIHPDDRGKVMAALEALFATGRPFDEQYRMKKRDGSWAWVYDRATATYERDGRRLTDGVLTDITGRKMADLLQSITLYLREADTFDAAIRTVIGKVCELTGWSYGEVWIPRPDGAAIEHVLIWRCGDEAGNGTGRKAAAASLSPGAGLPGRAWQEKRPVWVSDLAGGGPFLPQGSAAASMRSALAVPVIEDSKVLAVLVFFTTEPLERDGVVTNFVTAISAQLGSSLQKRLSEDARKEIQQRYEDLLDSITVGVYRDSLSPDGRFLEVNRAAVNMLEGSSREEILTHRSADFYVDRARRMEIGRKLEKEGFVRGEEIELVTLKGKRIWVSATAVMKRGAEGRPYVDGIVEDITEKKRLEEQLRHSQKLEAVGQLAGGVAHDFNNILTAIIGYGNLLLMKKGDDEVVRNYAEHVLTLSEKAAHLTQSLLVFSRKQVINPQPLEVNSLIRRVEKILARIIGEDIDLRADLAEGEITVRADSTNLEQIFMNLATNARDAMHPGGGVLSISTGVVELGHDFVSMHGYGAPGRYAAISVSDTGCGMDEETQKRIFEPFFTTKEVGKGTGLGLAVVYGIIKQHNGYVNVYSTPGIGSTFRIYLPIIEESAAARVNEEPVEIRGGTETILLAEDETEVREVNRSMLEEFGYTVIEAVDGEEAVEKFRERGAGVDLLLFDLMMPRKNGREALDEIRRARPDVRAIFMSGYAADIMRAKGALAAGTEFISKPASPGELLKKVREALDRDDSRN